MARMEGSEGCGEVQEGQEGGEYTWGGNRQGEVGRVDSGLLPGQVVGPPVWFPPCPPSGHSAWGVVWCRGLHKLAVMKPQLSLV